MIRGDSQLSFRGRKTMVAAGKGRLAQKVIALVVIVALLQFVGVSPAIMLFLTAIVFFVWQAARRSENQQTERIFDFYISADEILRQRERRWYGFEIAEVMDSGNEVLNSMPDPPPLSLFALGALCHTVGDHERVLEYLGQLIEGESSEEWQQSTPSPQLRRYVTMLRQLERNPVRAPLALGALRSLERLRERHTAEFLAESRRLLNRENPEGRYESTRIAPAPVVLGESPSRHISGQNGMVAPPPICDVLHDVYEDEKSA